MSLDFRAGQFRGAKFISSGSTGTGASLLFYPIGADSTTNPNIGQINTAVFGTGSIGTDIFLFISGGVGQTGIVNAKAITAFGGDIVVSGGALIKSGLTGALNLLPDGTKFLIGSGGLATSTGSNGQITIDATALSSSIATDVLFAKNQLYWQSTTNQIVFTTGSVLTTGSINVGTFLGVSTTATISQSLFVFQSASFGINNSTSIPPDTIVYISGAIGALPTNPASQKSLTLAADLVVSGNVWFKSSSQNPYSVIVGGNGVTSFVFSGSQLSLAATSVGAKINFAGGPYTNTQTDTYLFFSGAIGGKNGSSNNMAAFGGDLVVSGNSYSVGTASFGFVPVSTIGSDTQFYVSGTVGKILQGTTGQRNAVFNADIIISGSIGFRSSSTGPTNAILAGNNNSGIIFSGSLINLTVAGNTSANGRNLLQVSYLDNVGNIPTVNEQDVIFVVSGNVGGKNTSGGAVSLFRGDVVVSGNLYFGTGKKFTHFITIGSYTSTTLTSSNPQVAGQAVISQSEIPSSSIILRNVLSTTTGSITASLKLFNITSGAYVEIGGPGITTLNTVSTTPVQLQSVNLFGAINFGTGSNIYEVDVFIGTGSQQAILGSSMFICT